MIVVDASIALAWSYDDERTEAVLRVFERVAEHGAIAPGIWPLEIANSLQVSVRKTRISRPYRDKLLANFRKLAIEIDHHAAVDVWGLVLNLADRHKLTVYDSAYVELALRKELPLATLDRQLAAAARREGLSVLP